MEDIFVRAKHILIIWGNNVNGDDLPPFQEKIQRKAPYAELAFEHVNMLLESERPSSSFDLILFGLISNKDIPISIDLINEFFRLLRPEGHLITHIDNAHIRGIINNFKMCGFTGCNPLDSNSSFLIDNKDYEMKRLGTLWLCEKPSFDIGFSVSLRNSEISPLKKTFSPTSTGVKKTWTMDDDDLIDTDELLDENDRKKPDVKKYDCGTSSSGVRKACKNCNCGLAQEIEKEEQAEAKQTMKSSCGNCYLGDAFRCAGCPSRGLPPFKPGERVTLPTMSDV